MLIALCQPLPPSFPWPWQLICLLPTNQPTRCGCGQETGTHSEPQEQLLLGDRIVKFIGWMGGFYSRKSVNANGQFTVCSSIPATSMYIYNRAATVQCTVLVISTDYDISYHSLPISCVCVNSSMHMYMYMQRDTTPHAPILAGAVS